MEEAIEEHVSSMEVRNELYAALRPLYEMSLLERQELYVETFDYKEKTSLYMTSHELGDSRNRGVALIELQEMIRANGFERTDGELADYMPMLLEYLAVMPEHVQHQSEQLGRRVTCAIHHIMKHLPENNPYKGILQVLQQHVFGSPTDEEIAQFTKERENTDLDPLPYPMMYQ